MIFKQVQQVLDGTKTQTRRPVKDEWMVTDRLWTGTTDGWDTVQTVYEGSGVCRIKWQIGRTYAVQPGRGKKAVGRIRITKIRRERLQHIMQRDAIAEGVLFDSGGFYLPHWNFHGEGLNRTHDYGKAFENLWDNMYDEPYRWEDNPYVWVLDFELERRVKGRARRPRRKRYLR